MRMCRIFNQRCFLGLFNFVFMLCGIMVLLTGFYLFTDNKRILLSSLLIISSNDENPLRDLKHPLFIYIAFILTIFGMIIVSTSFLGYWTSMINNYCLLSIYFILILALLILKFSVCVVITIWPQCLGLKLNTTEMVKLLQKTYGVPGYEQVTVSWDYAQTNFDCCGVNDSLNYDFSLWRLQKFGKKELTVPMTCCKLINKFEKLSYLDPMPINQTSCQSLEPQEFTKTRHLKGCLDEIEYWYREHYIILLFAGLILALVEFFVLLFVVLTCTQMKQKQITKHISPINQFNDEHLSTRSDSFLRNPVSENIYHADLISPSPEVREVFVQPSDFHRSRIDNNDRYARNNYRLSTSSYLI